MAYNAYQNHGSVKFSYTAPVDNDPSTILFTYGVGTIEQKYLMNYDYNTNTGKRIRSVKGFRIGINVSLLILDDTDSAKLLNLITLINATNRIGRKQLPMYIAPRYDSTALYNDWYRVFITSNIAPIDILSINVGQRFDLTFLSLLLVSNLSSNITIGDNLITDEDDQQLVVTDDGTDSDFSAFISNLVG